jgi:hypothetical protein
MGSSNAGEGLDLVGSVKLTERQSASPAVGIEPPMYSPDHRRLLDCQARQTVGRPGSLHDRMGPTAPESRVRVRAPKSGTARASSEPPAPPANYSEIRPAMNVDRAVRCGRKPPFRSRTIKGTTNLDGGRVASGDAGEELGGMRSRPRWRVRRCMEPDHVEPSVRRRQRHAYSP